MSRLQSNTPLSSFCQKQVMYKILCKQYGAVTCVIETQNALGYWEIFTLEIYVDWHDITYKNIFTTNAFHQKENTNVIIIINRLYPCVIKVPRVNIACISSWWILFTTEISMNCSNKVRKVFLPDVKIVQLLAVSANHQRWRFHFVFMILLIFHGNT